MPAPWTPAFELDYARHTTPAALLKRHTEHARIFRVAETIAKHLPAVTTVADVGCGAIGGMLNVYNGGELRYAVDPLIFEYDCLEHLKSINATPKRAFAIELPFAGESLDVVFALEVLDHCDSEEVFRESLAELSRVLVSGGLLFFMLPARPDAPDGHDGHPCAWVSSKPMLPWIAEAGLQVLKDKIPRDGTWFVLRKPC